MVSSATSRSGPANRFQHHPQSGGVVHLGGIGQVVPHHLETELQGDGVSYSDYVLGLGLILGPDIQP
jgi:hypothetical protein